MKNLLSKEIKLAMHPTCMIFLARSMMLLIPNYPYYVTFFYTTLSIFFTCLTGRENQDISYSICLPICKRDIVKARFMFAFLLEILQLLLAIPFAFIRQHINSPGNIVGMDANIAFFGLALIMLGLFNLIFFSLYYKDVLQVGKAFVISSAAIMFYILVAEAGTHAIPFMRDKLDTTDPAFLNEKLMVLVIGILCYSLFTLIAYKRSVASFEKLDL